MNAILSAFGKVAMGKTRILLADDHTLVVEGLKKFLESEFEIVGMAHDGRTLLQLAPILKPDVIVVDINMPMLNGLDAGRQLKKLLPRTKLIVLTVNEDYDVASEVLHEWASGYLLKNSPASELVRAIWDVLKGKQYVAPLIAKRKVNEFIRDPRPVRLKNLTARQREVLQLLGEGRSMKEAAAVLQVATRTVAFHKYRIMEEFGLRTNSDLFRFAMKERVLSEL
jgi:DNA-binding NarL/FixJ family response regulator